MNPNTQPSPTILIVDDEPRNIQLLANLLTGEHYQVEFATGGAQALQWVEARSFDLILLDLVMPGLDGFDVCRQLKSRPNAADIPVLFLTAKTNTESIVQGFNAGAVDYITKPFQKEELLARVKTHLALQAQKKELVRTAHLLEEENNGKDRFFSILAHDLRNPLIGFIDFARLLEDFELIGPDRLKPLAQEFHLSAERLLNLLDNMLIWAQVQRGMVVVNRVCQPLSPLIAAKWDMLAVSARAKRISLRNKVEPGLEIYADAAMLEVVVNNLLTNALKFTAAGGVVEVCAKRDGTVVQVAISDSGSGLSVEDLGKIFEVGSRSKRNGTFGEKGSGLGLVICKDFIELNQGSIWAESQPGRGSTFYFRLPSQPLDQPQ